MLKTLENSRLCTYFTKIIARTYRNTFGDVLKSVTAGNGTELP